MKESKVKNKMKNIEKREKMHRVMHSFYEKNVKQITKEK